MGDKIKKLIKSRRFWVAVAGVIAVSAESLGFSISPEVVTNVVIIAASWIVGESVRSSEV
jgi:hypothetical protein|tara:strand:+ start:288 stop:467 length:180 start_codon:yes stop_codon:yes gene_type:complete